MKLKFSLLLLAPIALGALGGCTRDGKFQPVDMWNGSRLRPYEGFNFFPNNSEAQVPPAGTVARSQNRVNEPLYYGTQNGQLVTYNPLTADKSPADRRAILQRGQERYQIYCQPCHGLAGYGDGLIAKRGMAAPPSYHLERLRQSADGHLYDVIANGYGSMYSYGSRVPTQDRWAIVAYIRALQLSQRAPASAIPAGVKPGVVPPLNNDRKYMGGAAGGTYHGSGDGETPNEKGPNSAQPNLQPDPADPRLPTGKTREEGSREAIQAAKTPTGSFLLPPQKGEDEAKSAVTSPATPREVR